MSQPNESCTSCSVPNRGPCDTFRFQDLVFDVQINTIAYFVPPQDLLSLTLVSRHINSLATPALYSDVRLLFGLQPPAGSCRVQGAFTAILVSAQKAFIAQVLAHREHAVHVRDLAWQVDACCGPAFTDLFPLLENLTRIHLVNPHPSNMHEKNMDMPASFPRVRNVKLTGTTSLSFAMSVLHSPHRLTALSLDTIQPQIVALRLLDWVSKTDLPYLRTFSLRGLCQTREAQPWDISREKDMFSAWKGALSSVRSTLEDVTLGFRAEYTSVTRVSSPPPSAERFVQTVMPLFWEEKWPMLKIIQLEGIDLDGIGKAGSASRLRAAVPEVVVDPVVLCVQRLWDSQTTDKF